jgi:hypothetical protein
MDRSQTTATVTAMTEALPIGTSQVATRIEKKWDATALFVSHKENGSAFEGLSVLASTGTQRRQDARAQR